MTTDNNNYTKLLKDIKTELYAEFEDHTNIAFRAEMCVRKVLNREETKESTCLCCEGRCDCEYGCSHPHEETKEDKG